MKNDVPLKILRRFRGFFVILGCDYEVMEKILQVKLTMDGRRVPTVLRSRKAGDQSEKKGGFIASLWVYALTGLITVPLVLMNNNYLFQMGIVFGIFMFLITTSMISDFSSVLLDIRDRIILATKPVNKRTISCARFVHITIYLTLLTGSLTAIPLIAALLGHGVVFFLVFFVEIILMDIFIMVFTALLYLIVLHLFDGERLKDMINYVQIALSIAIVLGYQLIGRAFSLFKLHIVFHAAWWQFFLPPFWFGSTFQTITMAHPGKLELWLSALVVIVPITLFIVYVQLMPAFERKLQKLAGEDVKNRFKKRFLSHIGSKIFCSNSDERMWFDFALIMMARERDFKLKVYPSLGLAMVFPFMICFNPAFTSGRRGANFSLWSLSVYFCALMIPTVIMMLKFSSKYQAAWIYKITPLKSTEAVYKGVAKAFLYKFFLPIYLGESIAFVLIFSAKVIPDLVVACIAMWLYEGICFRMVGRTLPFSEPYQMAALGKNHVVLLLLLSISIFAGIHLGVRLLHFNIYLYLILLIVINQVFWRYGFKLNREQAMKVQIEHRAMR